MKKFSVTLFVVLLFIVPLIGLIPSEWNWNPRLEATIGTTIGMICAVVFLNHLFGYMAGKAIAFRTGKRIRLAEFLISLPLFVPVLLLSFGLYLTWIRLGLADRFLGVLLVLLLPTLPYTVRLYTNGFQALGERMLEQMILLEGNRLKRWFYLTGPMLRSTLQSVTLLVTVITLSQYALVALIGGGVVRMMAIEVFPAYSGNSQETARLATIWLIGLPVLLYAGQAIMFMSWIRIVRRRLNGSHDTTGQ